MVKFNVSFLLAALIASPTAAGYTTQSTTETEAICQQEVDVPDICDGSDEWYPVSVVGMEGYYCAKGPICAGESGNCPGPHRDLIYGSSCVSLSEGTYGCSPNTECPTESTELKVPEDCEVVLDTPAPVTPEVTTEAHYYQETATVPPPVYTPEPKTAPPKVDTPETATVPPPVYIPPPKVDTPETATVPPPVYTPPPKVDTPETATVPPPVYTPPPKSERPSAPVSAPRFEELDQPSRGAPADLQPPADHDTA
ncbi:uncharacterized protein PHALS_14108 [Plasmopara halstedii]|uniref:RxLR-like protein n=1 Tax=Plasmopara halstedii TaxID=4781 RepID=A0A0P1AQK2_PLAHL|nr:uncharacterized protein PHALS_14108 [Plasmopara halstedii]CEG43818.1 hypothetical protein PHALS_14108 [Plasmopara halstedii]|eukprot:XP_024580187.1 hypothetical protein PHALS_14108 [Plasmopara halstedii]